MKSGFTLIELLVVMVIISVITAAATITISINHNRQITTFTQELTNLLILAEEEAMLRPATLGVSFSQTTFQFYEYRQNIWRPLMERDLGLHPLPKDITLTIKINGATVTKTPQLIISPSGDLSPFVILIGKIDAKPMYEITGESNGNIRYAAE